MGKTLKNLLLSNQEGFEAESWYIASGTRGLSSLLKNGGRLTFDFLQQSQICALMHL